MMKNLWSVGGSIVYGLLMGWSVPVIVGLSAAYLATEKSNYQFSLIWIAPVLLLIPIFYIYGKLYRFLFSGEPQYSWLSLVAFFISVFYVSYINSASGAEFSFYLRSLFSMTIFFASSKSWKN